MDSRKSEGERVSSKRNIRSFLFNSPLVIGIVILLLEYYTNLFQANADSQIYYLFLVKISAILSIVFFFFCLFIIFLKRLFVREEYAQFALLFFSTSTLLTVISTLSKIMPWTAWSIAVTSPISFEKPPISEVVSLWALYLLLNYLTIVIYKKWNGEISEEEFNKKLNAENSLSIKSLFAAGGRQIVRTIKFKTSLERHKQTSSNQSGNQSLLTTSIWHKQAKELVSLANPSFNFGAEKSWRGQIIYVGENADTNEVILLNPRLTPVNKKDIQKKDIQEICLFAENLSNENPSKIVKIIIATKDNLGRRPKPKNFNIEYFDEELLLRKSVNFENYLDELKQRVKRDKLPNSNLTLEDVYVEPKISNLEKALFNKSIEEYLDDWLKDPTERQIALFGEHGQGKSTATLMWAYKKLNNSDISRFPILINLNGKSPRNINFSKIFDDWAAKYEINGQVLMKLHEKGMLVLIFEGFDEMALADDSEMKLEDFKSIWQFATPKSKIIVTGRANFFRDKSELKKAFGKGPRTHEPYFERINLLPFDIEQIEQTLRKTNEKTSDEIIRRILENPESKFAEIVSRPFLPHIISSFWTEKFSEQSNNLSLTKVMDSYVNHSYKINRHKEKDFLRLSNNQRCYFMTGIATFFTSQNLTYIKETELDKITEKLIKNIPYPLPPEYCRFNEVEEIPLREKIKKGFKPNFIKDDVRTRCLLVENKDIDGGFCFSHSLVSKFLCAEIIASQLLNSNEVTTSILQATNSKIDKILNPPKDFEHLKSAEFFEFLNELALQKLQAFHEGDKSIDFFKSKQTLTVSYLNHLCGKNYFLRWLIKNTVLIFEKIRLILRRTNSKDYNLEKRSFILFLTVFPVILHLIYLFLHLIYPKTNYLYSELNSKIFEFNFNGLFFENFYTILILFSLTTGTISYYITQQAVKWLNFCKNLEVSKEDLKTYLKSL